MASDEIHLYGVLATNLLELLAVSRRAERSQSRCVRSTTWYWMVVAESTRG